MGRAARAAGAGVLALLIAAGGYGAADAIDVEQFTRPDVLDQVVEAARAAGVAVVMSSHDFTGTPPHDEIVSRLLRQQELGADVVKLAAMPATPADVLTPRHLGPAFGVKMLCTVIDGMPIVVPVASLP